MNIDYEKCVEMLQNDTLSMKFEKLEKCLLKDCPDSESYNMFRFLFKRGHLSDNIHLEHTIDYFDEDVSDDKIISLCEQYPKYEWWARCIIEMHLHHQSLLIERKQLMAEIIYYIFDYYRGEILPKLMFQNITGSPPPKRLSIKHAPPITKKSPIILPRELDTERFTSCLNRAITAGFIKVSDDCSHLIWLGDNQSGSSARLAYFCGLIFGYKIDSRTNGNAGGRVPYTALENLFSVHRLDRALRQVHEASKPQLWRSLYDNLLK